jgi:prepilin-type N-terminal cleavage/methylation domain-containing protein
VTRAIPVRADFDTTTSRNSPDILLGRSGSTLIEVLTAVAIFSIVLTAAFATFTFQKQSYTTQTHVAEMQQNLRVSIDTLLRDIRMGGYGVDSDITVPASAVGATGSPVVIRGFYGADGLTTSPDNIYILYAYDMDNTVSDMQPTLTTVAFTAGNSPSIALNVTAGTGSRFAMGDTVILNNGTTADLYQVTAPSSDNNSVTIGSSSVINASGHSSNIYDVGSKVSRARFVRYWIDGSDPAHPALMVTRLPGSVSQEDLQFVYGLASLPDNTLVSTTVNAPGSTSDRQLIRRINLSIVARTGVYEKGWSGQRPALGNRSAGAADQYRRRILDTMAVDIRNIRLN